MPPKQATPGSSARLTRVFVYYILLAGVLALIHRFVPNVWEILGEASAQSRMSAEQVFGRDAAPEVGVPLALTPGGGPLLAAVSMIGALVIMIPVTWVYLATRGVGGYGESVVHTLLILPIAVTGILLIVQHNLAIAFSLAGIVAAVRFRTTLEDTKDAVYVFLAIGVGVASGVQALGVALTLSVVFNAVVLVLWRTKFGNPYAELVKQGEGIGLGDALTGLAATPVQVIGDRALFDAATSADLAGALSHAARMERHISEERAKKKSKRINTLFLIHAPGVQAAQAVVEPVLEELTARWKLAEVVDGGPDGHVLEYLARLDAPGAEGAILDRLKAAPQGVIGAAEARSLKGLKKRS